MYWSHMKSGLIRIYIQCKIVLGKLQERTNVWLFVREKQNLPRSISQLTPASPVRHVHLYPSTVVEQLPSFMQGFEAHSSANKTNIQ